MIESLKQIVRKNLVNIPGWRTKEKLVVFESDDWGSIRIRSKEDSAKLIKSGVPLKSSPFTSYDGLETTKDLENLFDVLSSVKDSEGKPAIFTPLALVANPDFEKIKSVGLKDYFNQDIIETYREYNENRLMSLWKDNMNTLFKPQFHGREHLNYKRWLKAINKEGSIARRGFEQMCIIGVPIEVESQVDNYMAGFEAVSEREKAEVEVMIIDGLELFEKIFGFRSRSFMPSQSIWNSNLHPCLLEAGVCFNQGGQQFKPSIDGLKRLDHWWGKRDRSGMLFWRRNCNFEPYKSAVADHVNNTLKEMSIAFRWGKPAVISTHRINFTSRITSEIRDRSLREMNKLLNEIVERWPDVQFISSDQLCDKLLEAGY